MKTIVRYTVMALLGLLALSGCQRENPDFPIGDRTFYRCLIASYMVPLNYQARYANLDLYNPNPPKDAVQAVYFSKLEYIAYNPFWGGYSDKHEEYARRYQDTTYNRMMSTPFDTEALAEPLDSIRCYALSKDGSEVDISAQIKCLFCTYLPYIRSGYRDDLVPEGVTGKLWWRYEVYKPLKELTQEDLTLVDSHSGFRLEAIPPYQFDSDVLVRVFSSADEVKEVVAYFATQE